MSKLFFISVVLMTPFAFSACGGGGHEAGHDHGQSMESAPAAAVPGFTVANFDKVPRKVGEKAYCPIMEHEFTVTADSPHSSYKGLDVVFCCGGCKPTFDKDPEKYYSKFLKK